MTDDSEEVFRRAAENYPLNTANADWETVHKKMEVEVAATHNEPGNKKRNYRGLSVLLLLLLLSLVVIENRYIHYFNGKTKQEAVSALASTQNNAEKTNGQPGSGDKGNNSTSAEISKAPSLAGGISSTGALDKNNKTPGKKTNNISIDGAHQSTSSTPVSETNTASPSNTLQRKNNAGSVVNATGEKISNRHNSSSYASKQKTRMKIINAESSSDKDEPIVTTENKSTPVMDAVKEKVLDDATIAKEESTEKKLQPEIKKTSEKEIAKNDEKTEVKPDKKTKSKQKHFYAGLIAGPDFSTIKMQSVKKTGLSYGLIAGYRINNKFSIETGLLKDKKFYSSKGEYFSTKKIWMPSGSNIEYVQGDCQMYELPINIYYAFSRKPESSWFGAAGISSYFMNKESYTFDVKHNGETYPYNADYKRQDNQFAAVINLSAGYSHKIGKLGDLRLEPYLKLPVGKIGTGDLPIQSAGVLIGFTRFLF